MYSRFQSQKFPGFPNTDSSLAWGEREGYLLKQVCMFSWTLTFSNKNSTTWVWFLPAARWSGVLPLWSRRVILQMAGSLLIKYSTMGIDPCSHAMWKAVILSDRCHIHTVNNQLVCVLLNGIPVKLGNNFTSVLSKLLIWIWANIKWNYSLISRVYHLITY